MKLDRVLQLQREYETEAVQIYKSALRLQLTSSEICDRIVDKIYREDNYYKTPRHCRSFIDGFIDGLAHKYWENVVFAYVVYGTVLPIDSEEYKKIPAATIAERYGPTGHFVYRINPMKRYTQPECPYLRAKTS